MAETSLPELDCIGVVLAGGRSRRMGRDKALLRYGASTLLQHQADTLARLCRRVVISGDYAGYDCVRDIRPGLGPLSGMHAVAREFETRALLFLPVDMPAMTVQMLQKLLIQGGPCHFDRQPLPCLFPDASALASAIEQRWDCADQDNAVTALHRTLASRTLGFSGTAVFENLNTPAQWQHFNSSVQSI
jgi:molybdenum cofactor guanylyltransferase